VSTLAIILCIVCQLFLVVGQLFLKRAMDPKKPGGWGRLALRLAPGIGCMTIWFFLWLGLLEKLELSRIFPFEGLNPPILVLGAVVVFKEKLAPSAWLGMGLITVGIVLVTGS
jgi:undecaprenyl phosphate-alpha-L-ara4N flippase subunit ArnE